MFQKRALKVLLVLFTVFNSAPQVTLAETAKDINLVNITETTTPNISTVIAANHTNISVFLKSTSSSWPTADMFDITRKLNGVKDGSFVWNGGISSWDRADKVLVIEGLPYIQGAEYIVTDKANDVIQNEIEDISQFDATNLNIAFNGAIPSGINAGNVDIKRYINGQLDTNFLWWGGTSSVNSSTNTLVIYNIGLPEPGAEEKSVHYSVGYKGTYVDSSAFIMKSGTAAPIAVKNVSVIKSINVEVKFSKVPEGYGPSLSSIIIRRYINGVLDNGYMSTPPMTKWTPSLNKMTIVSLPYLEGVRYEVTENPSDTVNLVVEEVVQNISDDLCIWLNRVPENVRSIPFTVKRVVNGISSDVTGFFIYFDQIYGKIKLINLRQEKVSYTEAKTISYSVSAGDTPAAQTSPYILERGELPPGFAVSLNRNNIVLGLGEKVQLVAEVTPQSSENKNVLWSLQNKTGDLIAIVTPDGRVFGLKPGTAVVRATSECDSSIYAECTVTVIKGTLDVNGDGNIDTMDLEELAQSYNKNNTSTDWNNKHDFNGDMVIDIFDIAIMSSQIR